MKSKSFLTVLLLFVLTLTHLGCSFTGAPPVASREQGMSDLKTQPAGNYATQFEIQFDGSSDWTYNLQSRVTPTLRENILHITGIDEARNPGDIRLVTDGTSTWMIGEGTDQECVRFPNNQGMDPTLILPESLVSLTEAGSLLRLAKEEEWMGKSTLHYSGSDLTIGSWQNTRLDVWQDKTNRNLLGFRMQATAEDPFFGAGNGNLEAQYQVTDLGDAAIEPVAGCELSIPLPDIADKIVRLPGLASFESSAGIEEISKFFQATLPQEGWTENEPPSQAEDSVVLSFTRGEENVEIQIKANAAGGSKVSLIFP